VGDAGDVRRQDHVRHAAKQVVIPNGSS